MTGTIDLAWIGEQLLRGTQPAGRDPTALVFDEFRSREEYLAHRERTVAVHHSRRQIELLLARQPMPATIRGYDALLDRPVEFTLDALASFETVDGIAVPNYRERVISPATRLNGRMRGTLLAIRDHLRHDLSGRVYLTERLGGFYEFVAARNSGVVGSEFLGEAVAPGGERDGIRNENVMALSFPDASFELVVCCEVLEHVTSFRRALHELRRVLAPEGLLVLTLPFLPRQPSHVVRAHVDDTGALVHDMPPEYHGDPLNPAGILCYRNFGWRLLDDLREAGFADAGVLFYWNLLHGLIGENLTVFWARA